MLHFFVLFSVIIFFLINDILFLPPSRYLFLYDEAPVSTGLPSSFASETLFFFLTNKDKFLHYLLHLCNKPLFPRLFSSCLAATWTNICWTGGTTFSITFFCRCDRKDFSPTSASSLETGAVPFRDNCLDYLFCFTNGNSSYISFPSVAISPSIAFFIFFLLSLCSSYRSDNFFL